MGSYLFREYYSNNHYPTYSVKTHSWKRISAPFLTIATRLFPLIPFSSNPRTARLFPGLSRRMAVYTAARGSRYSPGERSRMHIPPTAPRSSDTHSIDALIWLVSLAPVNAMLDGPEFLVVRQEIGSAEAHTLSGWPDDAANLSAVVKPPVPRHVVKVWHSGGDVSRCRLEVVVSVVRMFPPPLLVWRCLGVIISVASTAARATYATIGNPLYILMSL